jgi:DNA-binding CsgD family transcriptional regulator
MLLLRARVSQTKSALNSVLKAALEGISSPALIFTDGGGVVEANAPGRALLGQHRDRVRCSLTFASQSGQAFFQIAPLYKSGNLVHYLAVLRADIPVQLDRLALAAHRWQLSPRETSVLSHLIHGHSNKGVAKKLTCSERTVEQHVRKMLGRAGVKGRSALLVKFWKDF